MSIGLFLFALFFALLILYFIHERLKLFQLFTRIGIPGPHPNIFVGNMMQLTGKGKLVTEVMAEWEAQYGLFYGYFRGTRATLVVRDPEVVKDILVRNSSDFINRPHMVMNIPPIPDTVVGLRGQRWKKVRHTLSPLLSSSKIKQMFPIMSHCVETTIEILREKHAEKEAVDVHKLFQGLACDVISVCALAMKVNSQRDAHDKFFVAVKGFLENAMGPFVKTALCLPLLAKVMEKALTTFGYSHEMTKMIMESVRTAMKIRRESKEKVQLNNNCNDGEHRGALVVDALQLMMDASKGSGDLTLSDEEIVANAWIFILGGFETTSSALTYTCFLLSLHSSVQEKLFLELKNYIEIDEVPSYDKLGEFQYLDQVICESLRLYPPVVNFVVRGLEKDSQIGPYMIPKNVGIQIPVWQIHHDPNIWDEPYRFDPDRFKNNAKKIYANNMEWIPFGSGPRNCLGARFALLNLKFTLVSILRKFKVTPASTSGTQSLKLKVPSVTIVPDGGVPLKFVPRGE